MENVFISKHTVVRTNRDVSLNVPFCLNAYDVNTGLKKQIAYYPEGFEKDIQRMTKFS